MISAFLNYSGYQISASNYKFNFLDQFYTKIVFPVEDGKSKHHRWILNLRVSHGTNFALNWQFWFFGPNFPKTVFLIKNARCKHHCWILKIRISLCNNFQLKQTILNYGTKFSQIRYFRTKTGKVIITIDFSMFELVYNNFLNNFRLLDVLSNFPFTTSGTNRYY